MTVTIGTKGTIARGGLPIGAIVPCHGESGAPGVCTGQTRSHWDTGWDSLGTLGFHGDDDAGKSGTRQQKPCPRLLRLNIPVGTPTPSWTVGDWAAFFDERAGILEHDAGLDRELAERGAFEHCVVRWLERHRAAPRAVELWPGSELEFRLARIRHAITALGHLQIKPPQV